MPLLTRKQFLVGLASSCAAVCAQQLPGIAAEDHAQPATLFAKRPEDYDQNLTVLLSDIHVRGNLDGNFQLEYLSRLVADILKFKPLPARVIVLGDLAHATGRPEDYARSQPLFKQLQDAGIQVTLALGNHDHRQPFFEAYPEYLKTSPVPQRAVSIVETPHVDFIVLDSLHEVLQDGQSNFVAGTLDNAQIDWLQKTLPARPKPFFVCAHHPLKELPYKPKQNLAFLFRQCPRFAGFIHGHDHVWRVSWTKLNYKDSFIARTLCLPSTGHWGDIGFVLLRSTPDRAVAELRQSDFFFPTPLAPEKRPPHWDLIVRDHHGQACSFLLP